MAACKGSVARSATIDWSRHEVGDSQSILVHPACSCNTGCRRLAVSNVRPRIDESSDWVTKVIARVRFGDGCDGPEVEADVKRGVILDLLGCYTEVSLELVELVGTPPPIRYTALSACCGAGGARGIATRTLAPVTAPGGGANTIIPIPPFAYAVRFATVDPAALASLLFIVVGSGAGAFPTTIIDLPIINSPEGYPLPGGAQSIIANNQGEGAVTFEPVFLIGI